jgi:hypothetical protein
VTENLISSPKFGGVALYENLVQGTKKRGKEKKNWV